MKREIRCGVFETNSSSTHSIALESNAKIVEKIHNGEIKKPLSIYFGLFDEHDYCTTEMNDKANFLYSEILYSYSIETIEFYKSKIKEYLGSEGIDSKFADYQIKDGEPDLEELYDLNIDHDSMNSFYKIILKSKETLFDYLFGENSVILLGRDGSNKESENEYKERGCEILYSDNYFWDDDNNEELKEIEEKDYQLKEELNKDNRNLVKWNSLLLMVDNLKTYLNNEYNVRNGISESDINNAVEHIENEIKNFKK